MAPNRLWDEMLAELPSETVVHLAKAFPASVNGFRIMASNADALRPRLASASGTKARKGLRREILSHYEQLIQRQYPRVVNIPSDVRERIEEARRALGLVPSELTDPAPDVHDQVAQWRQQVLTDLRAMGEHLCTLSERIARVEQVLANQADGPPPVDIAPLRGDLASLNARVSTLSADMHYLTGPSLGGE